MTAINPPATFGATKGDVGYDYVFGEDDIRQELTERLNALEMGLVMGVGNLTGTGSDTIRLTYFGDVGFAEEMQAMAGETDPIVATGFSLGNDEASIARHGLAKEESYQNRLLARPDTVNLDKLVQLVPASWLKTLRKKVCLAGSGFAQSEGSSGQVWTFDDELDMIAAFHETEGFDAERGVITVRDPEQFTQLRDSLRNEPGFQSPEVMAALFGLKPGGGAFDFLGIKNHASHDVVESGGDHVGFAYVPGAIAWVVATTEGLLSMVEDPDRAMLVPEFGIVIERKSSGNQAQARFDANAWFGVARRSTTLFPAMKLISKAS